MAGKGGGEGRDKLSAQLTNYALNWTTSSAKSHEWHARNIIHTGYFEIEHKLRFIKIDV